VCMSWPDSVVLLYILSSVGETCMVPVICVGETCMVCVVLFGACFSAEVNWASFPCCLSCAIGSCENQYLPGMLSS
jgi:hypothetical protein